jgi:hypothetical protein
LFCAHVYLENVKKYCSKLNKMPFGSSSELTEYRKNRMIYANFIIRQQNVTVGAAVEMGLENGKVAAGSIMPQLKTGAIFTTEAERNNILSTSASENTSPPSTPTILSVTEANEQLIIVFQLSTGTNTVYEYTLDDGATFVTGGTSSPLIVAGLTNGTEYIVAIRARNSGGVSSSSNSISGTPSLTRVTFTTVESTTWTAPTNIFTVNYLVVGGGGGSGGAFDNGGAGGGGGGMVLIGTLSTTPAQVYTVTVGDGGSAGVSLRGPPSSETSGADGENSVFGSITSLGGGGGKGSRQTTGAGTSGIGGAAAVNPTTASIGGNGGGAGGGGGGGGGSSGAGGTKNLATAGSGGSGTANSLSGSSVTYGVGGGGGTGSTANSAVAGTANTGNGAKAAGTGTSSETNGAKGGSGIIVLVY